MLNTDKWAAKRYANATSLPSTGRIQSLLGKEVMWTLSGIYGIEYYSMKLKETDRAMAEYLVAQHEETLRIL